MGRAMSPISAFLLPISLLRVVEYSLPPSSIRTYRGSLRRTNSAYFGFCNAHHLPDYTDLVILEFDVDDSP